MSLSSAARMNSYTLATKRNNTSEKSVTSRKSLTNLSSLRSNTKKSTRGNLIWSVFYSDWGFHIVLFFAYCKRRKKPWQPFSKWGPICAHATISLIWAVFLRKNTHYPFFSVHWLPCIIANIIFFKIIAGLSVSVTTLYALIITHSSCFIFS